MAKLVRNPQAIKPSIKGKGNRSSSSAGDIKTTPKRISQEDKINSKKKARGNNNDLTLDEIKLE